MSIDDVCSNKVFMSGISASIGLTMFLFTFLIWPAIVDDHAAIGELKITTNDLPSKINEIQTEQKGVIITTQQILINQARMEEKQNYIIEQLRK